jgi:hypothetical protein
MKAAFLYLLLGFGSYVSAQDISLSDVQLKPKLSLSLELQSDAGFNGAAVAWHPLYEKYYTLIAGNAEFPIEVFDIKGKHLQTRDAGQDCRGLWYNFTYEYLEANTYETHDIISYEFEGDGFLSEDQPYEELYELPIWDPQAVIALDVERNSYVWYNYEENVLIFVSTETGDEEEVLPLDLPVDKEFINSNTVIYTGITGAEYGLLNIDAKQVYLINKTDGKVSATVQLPAQAVVGDAFRFSFANGHVWIFDADERRWDGFKLY